MSDITTLQNQKDLIKAIRNNLSIETITFLLDQLENINYGETTTSNPLLCACSDYNHFNPDLITTLLNKGADVNVTTSRNNTCIHFLARMGALDLIKDFEERGADIFATDKYDRGIEYYSQQTEDDKVILAFQEFLQEREKERELKEKEKENSKLREELERKSQEFESLKQRFQEFQNILDNSSFSFKSTSSKQLSDEDNCNDEENCEKDTIFA